MLTLLTAASTLAGTAPDRAVAMANIVTGSDGSVPVARGHSGLNHDGTPLQLCVTIDADGPRYRLLGDPAADVPQIGRRFHRSLVAAEALLPMAGAEPLRPLVETTLRALVGGEKGFEADRHPDGVLWLAGQLEGRGLALYVDARDGGVAPMERLRDWLAKIVTATPDGAALLAAVAAGRVMSAGLEGVAPGYARAKIYWRLAEPGMLADSPIALFGDPAFADVVQGVIGARDIRLDGIVLSAGLAIPSGELADAKLDICCCPRCVHLDTPQAAAMARELAIAHGLPAPDIVPLLAAGELAFIGFGLTRDRAPRINLYFKPRLGSDDGEPG
jgi:hypothetical protein